MNSSARQKIFNNIVEEIDNELDMNVVNLLSEEEEVTDEQLAQKTGLKLNIVRKILYKLYDNHLASYRRMRDKNTGWFIYYWKLNPNKIYDVVKKRQEGVLRRLEERLKFEKGHQFYYCETDDSIRLTFEEAMEAAFKCPHCDKMLIFKDNSDIINVLTKKINDLKKSF